MPKRSRGAYLKWRKDKKAWYIYDYSGERDCRFSTGTDDRQIADHALSDYILKNRKVTGTTSPEVRLIGDAIADYIEEHGKYLKSKKTLVKCVEALTPFWGHNTVDYISQTTCRDYLLYRNKVFKKWLKKKKQEDRDIKPSVVARELSVLSAAINHDHKSKRLTHPVFVWMPKFSNEKDKWLTRKDVAALIKSARAMPGARDYLPLFILTGIYTGARHSAILGLTWDRIDLESGLIDFNDRSLEKTNKGRALLPAPRRLMTFLRIYHRRRKSPFLIARNGRQMLSIKVSFGQACAAAGLPDITPHTLRHTAASWMTQAGVSFPRIARYLGHADSRTTEMRYAHHAPDYLSDAAAALDNLVVTAPYTAPQKKNTLRQRSKDTDKSIE